MELGGNISTPELRKNEWLTGSVAKSSKAYMSYGGLLMALDGPYKKLTPLRVDYVYLLASRNA